MWRDIAMGMGIVLVVLAVVAVAAHAGNRGKVLKEQEIKKITDAMPDKAPATPLKKRKVLVYSKCSGFYHGSIPYGNKAFEIMGAKTGAFEAVVSDDLSNFEADKLKEFDAIILNNTTGELLKARAPRKPRKPDPKRIKDPARLEKAQVKYKADLARYEEQLAKHKAQPDRSEQLRKNLMDWIKSGKGVIGTHAATDCSYQWKEYGQMIGGYFSGHPWGGGSTITLKVDDPANPINAAFGGEGVTFKEEIYQFNRGVYSRQKQRVLLSIDLSKTKKAGGCRRDDDDYAVSWVKTHGQGRIFYCSLGHNNHIFSHPKILRQYLAGIQWALGDLTGVDTAPNPLAK